MASAFRGETVDLLITAVTLRGMKGPELAERWLERSPDTRVLLLSFDSDEELRDTALIQSGRAEFIAQPATPDRLISIVRKMLARNGGPGPG